MSKPGAGPELAVTWKPITANLAGKEFPWPVIATDLETGKAILNADYGRYEDDYNPRHNRGVRFIDGYRGVFGKETEDLLWRGLRTAPIIKAATFGEQRHMYALSTEEVEDPGRNSFDIVHYAVGGSLPAVVAFRAANFRRVWGEMREYRELIDEVPNLDAAVEAVMFVDNGDFNA